MDNMITTLIKFLTNTTIKTTRSTLLLMTYGAFF